VHPPVDEALIFKAEMEQALARRALSVTISDDLSKRLVLPARRMPITAVALPVTVGSQISRRLILGSAAACESTIFY